MQLNTDDMPHPKRGACERWRRPTPKRRSKGVHVGERARIVLGIHLAGDRQIRGLGKEIIRVVNAAIWQSHDAAHCPGPV